LLKAERTSRAASLRGIAEAKKRAFAKALVGLPQLVVLVEKAEGGQGAGVCEYYAPCLVRGQGLRRGMLVAMRPERLVGGVVEGMAL